MAKGGKADGGLRSVMMTNLRKLGGHWQPIETGMIVSGVLFVLLLVVGFVKRPREPAPDQPVSPRPGN